MFDIQERLRNAQERAVILNVLAEAKQGIIWNRDCSAIFEGILNETDKIDKFLTQNEISSHVDSLFSTANPLYALPVLGSHLSTQHMADRVLFWLTLCLRDNLDRTLKDSIYPINDDFIFQNYMDFVSCLIFIREKAFNVAPKTRVFESMSSSSTIIESALCSAVFSCFQHVYELVLDGMDVDLRVISLLVAKSRTVAVQDSTLLHYVVKWLCSQDQSPLWDRIAQRVFTDESVGSRDAEALITAVALYATSAGDLMRCFGFAIRRNTIIHRVCCTKLLLQRVCDVSTILTIAEYLHTAASKDMFVETMKAVISVWSDPAHVRYVAVEQQVHLTRVVLALGRWLKGLDTTKTWQSLFDLAIQGVEQRLANPDVIIRQSGMFVGEAFSVWMGGERLEFDYQDDSWLHEMRNIRDGKNDEVTTPKTELPLESMLDPVDMQVPASSSSLANTQSYDSDDDEDFPAYDIPESEKNVGPLPADGEEPERTCVAPNYIKDCLEQLGEKEKYEIFEAAFFALDGMIRRKAVGFVDIAEQLIRKLLFLEDKFSSRNFEETRKQCMISCLVMRPELAPRLGDLVFSRSCAFSHRYLILECFLAAAKEMSEFQKEPIKKIVEVSVGGGELNDWRSIVDARIRSRTRRFITERKTETAYPNRFAAVATLFFYPLLKTRTGEHLELKGRDSPFLARLLFCVSEILQKAANAPSVVRMASSLLEVVTPLRFHPDAFIRSSVLYAYFSIANAVPESVFVEFFGKVVQNWVEWIISCADDVDAAEHQRTLARNVATALLQKMGAKAATQEVSGIECK